MMTVQEKNVGLKCPKLLTLKALPPTAGDAVLLPGHGSVLGRDRKTLGLPRKRGVQALGSLHGLSDQSYGSKTRLKENEPPRLSSLRRRSQREQRNQVSFLDTGEPQPSPAFPVPPRACHIHVTAGVRTPRARDLPRRSGGSGGHRTGFPGCWCPRSGSRRHPGPCF